jgi:short-subunit dehydrogenase
MKRLQYRTALITGASSGLGRGLAVWFAERGVEVYAAARRGAELERLHEQGRRLPASINPVVLDVSNAKAVIDTVRDIEGKSGGLDLVIANAGTSGVTDARNIDWHTTETIIDVNVRGAAATLCAALPGMVARNRGHIVGVSSLSRHRGLPSYAAYAASKAFLSTFLEGLRLDLHDSKVDVTCLQPGFVKTAMTERNKFYMPFLMELGDGVEQMAQAIVRREREYSFPWSTRSAVGIVRALPNAVFDRLSAKVAARITD